MRGMQDKGTRAFFESLVPKHWDWIGRQAMLRGATGVFTLEEWSDGTHGNVSGLIGRFTSDAGAQSTIYFGFEDLLVPTNPKGNPSWDNDNDPLRGWWNRSKCDWYIGRPKSLKPMHDAITRWVDIWSGEQPRCAHLADSLTPKPTMNPDPCSRCGRYYTED